MDRRRRQTKDETQVSQRTREGHSATAARAKAFVLHPAHNTRVHKLPAKPRSLCIYDCRTIFRAWDKRRLARRAGGRLRIATLINYLSISRNLLRNSFNFVCLVFLLLFFFAEAFHALSALRALGKRQEHFSRSLYFSYLPSNMQMNFYCTLFPLLLTPLTLFLSPLVIFVIIFFIAHCSFFCSRFDSKYYFCDACFESLFTL